MRVPAMCQMPKTFVNCLHMPPKTLELIEYRKKDGLTLIRAKNVEQIIQHFFQHFIPINKRSRSVQNLCLIFISSDIKRWNGITSTSVVGSIIKSQIFQRSRNAGIEAGNRRRIAFFSDATSSEVCSRDVQVLERWKRAHEKGKKDIWIGESVGGRIRRGCGRRNVQVSNSWGQSTTTSRGTTEAVEKTEI